MYLGEHLSWWTLVVSGIATFLFVSWRTNPARALGITVAIAYCLPSWIILPIFDASSDTIYGSGIDVKFTVAVSCLVLYCFMPGRTFPTTLVASDYAMLGLISVHVFVDIYKDGFQWMHFGRAYAEWYLPYICGRVALQFVDDIQPLARTMAILAILLGTAAIIEATTFVNPFEQIWGPRPIEGFDPQSARWGFKRAYGPCMHPIYCGGLMLILLGPVAFLSIAAAMRRFHPAWLFAPLPVVLGIAATGSRGPILGIAAFCLFFFFVRVKRSRIPLAVSALAGIIALVVFQSSVLRLLEKWSGEDRESVRLVKIDDASQQYTGTRNRLLLIDAYKIALRRSGLLGFGTQAVTGFPVNVPIGQHEAATMKRIRYIDNLYVLLTLRFGYLGSGLFLTAILCALVRCNLAHDRAYHRSYSIFLAGTFSSLATISLLLLTVWMPYELSFPMIMSMGATSALQLSTR